MEFTQSKHNIFIVADDLGLDPAVNRGIFSAFKNGLIGGASLMANGEAFNDAVTQCLEAQSSNIGVHLVLVEEKSLLSPEKIPTLLNKDGLFYKNYQIFFIRYTLGLIKKDQIKEELEAQINKCIAAGIRPKFINSHQHLHLLPGILDVVISLAKKYGISYVRIVHEPIRVNGSLFRMVQLCFLRFLSGMAKKKIIQNGLRCNDFFVGFINAGRLGVDEINLAKKLQNKYPNKFIELGCHPGFEGGSMVEKYHHWRYNWQKELEILEKEVNYNEKT